MRYLLKIRGHERKFVATKFELFINATGHAKKILVHIVFFFLAFYVTFVTFSQKREYLFK